MMALKVVMPSSTPDPSKRDTSRDYVPPPRDYSMVKIEIIRACWLTMPGESAMRTAKPGDVLLVPRWLANELATNGKATLH